MHAKLTILALAAATLGLHGQTTPPPDSPHREWKAAWITHPTAPLRDPIVLHFRRTLDLPAVPATEIYHTGRSTFE